MPSEETTYTGFQLRRMGFPKESRYCILRRLPVGDFKIGRYPNHSFNELHLPSTFVSKQHCRIEFLNGQFFLHDSSSNGTYVNGERYVNQMIEIRQEDRIGIGFPVTETNCTTEKSFYGFVLEREEIKMEVKEEPEHSLEEEGSLMIDENFINSTSETPSPDPAEQVIAEVDNQQWDQEMKEELFKRELEDNDMGSYTDDDDDDDVVFVGYVEPQAQNVESFPYMNQFSQAPPIDDDEERYNSTQVLLQDLIGQEAVQEEPAESELLQEEPIVAPVEEGSSNNTRDVISDPQPSTLRVTDPQPPPSRVTDPQSSASKVSSDPQLSTSSLTDPQPSTSKLTDPQSFASKVSSDPQPSMSKMTDPQSSASKVTSDPQPSTSSLTDPQPSTSKVTAPPLDPLEILNSIDLDTLLETLMQHPAYNIDYVLKKLHKGGSTDKKKKEKEKERSKKDDSKRSSSKHHDRKKDSKQKKPPTVVEDPSFPLPQKVLKRRESYKDRSSSHDNSSKETKSAPVKQRRKSTPATEPEPAKSDHRRSSEKEAEPQSILPVVKKPHQISIEDHIELASVASPPLPESDPVPPPPPPAAPAPCESHQKPNDIIKSPEYSYESYAPPTDKRRRLNEYSVLNLKPVPDPVPIEDIFSASQLPPSLDVVPEPKEPDYKYKLFEKRKVRVAHNKLPEKKESKKDSKEKEREKEAPKRKVVERKPTDNYRIPFKSARRESTDDILSLLDQIDDAIQDDSNDHKDQRGPSREPVPVEEQMPIPATEPELVSSEKAAEPLVTNVPISEATPDPFPLENEAFWASVRSGVVLSSLGTYNDPSIIQNLHHVFAVPKTPERPLTRRPERRALPPNPIANGRGPPPNPIANIKVPPPNSIANGKAVRDPRLQNGFVPMVKTSLSSYNCANILSEVLSWNVDWIGTENPPVVEDITQLSSMPNTFQSYAQYVNTLVPLLKLELFQYIEDTYPVKRDKATVEADVITEDRYLPRNFNSNFLKSFQCEINSRVYKQQFLNIRIGTLVIISTPTHGEYFGYIMRVIDLGGVMAKTNITVLVSEKFPITSLLRKRIRICFLVYLKVDLESILSLGQVKNFPLLRQILNPLEIEFDRVIVAPGGLEWYGKEPLNQYQYEAMALVTGKVEREQDKPHIFLVEGPPGTGKSRLIANTITHLIRNPSNRNKGFRILLCAPSNNAVDSLTEKLIEFRSKLKDEERRCFKLVRYGDNIGKTVENFSIRCLLDSDVGDEISRVAQSFNEFTEEQKERQKFIDEIRILNRALRETNLRETEVEAHKIRIRKVKHDQQALEKKMFCMKHSQRDLDKFKQKRRQLRLDGANIIACTLTSCISLLNNSEEKFTIAIIDECTQATEISCLMALSFEVKNLLMIGDTQQLPALIKNPEAKNLGLGKSLFARIQAASNTRNYLSLNVQYRMHPEILRFPNAFFYNNQIMNGVQVNGNSSYKLRPYLVFKLESEQNFTQNPHCYNTDEVDFVMELIKAVKRLIEPENYTIGVVTPYAKQKQLIEAKLGSDTCVTVYTIDAIQGQEKDIIIFSCVRTKGYGFMSSPERVNVALTRARKSLFICGNFSSLQRVEVWRSLLDDAKSRHLIIEDPTDLRQTLLNC